MKYPINKSKRHHSVINKHYVPYIMGMHLDWTAPYSHTGYLPFTTWMSFTCHGYTHYAPYIM